MGSDSDSGTRYCSPSRPTAPRMARAQPMFYVIQNEDDYQHPNAFFVPSSGRAATMGDFLSHFPLVSEAFHFRFQADDESGSYLWLDAPTDPDVEIPEYSGRILCKALRLGGKKALGNAPKRAAAPATNKKPAPVKTQAPKVVTQPAPAVSTPTLSPVRTPSAPVGNHDPFCDDPFGGPPPVVQSSYAPSGGPEQSMKGSKLDEEIEAQMVFWSTKGGAQAGGTGLRNLLCTVHEVLWQGAKWEPKGLSSLIQTKAVKDTHRKCMLLVHPDRNRKASPQQQLVAERIFNVLTKAWAEFEEKEGKLQK